MFIEKFNKIRRIAGLTLAIFCAAMFFNPGDQYTAYAGTTSTTESIRQKQEQIKEAEALKKKLKENISNAKAIKKQLEALKNDVASYISELDANLVEIQDKIEELKNLIAEKQQEIEETTAELELAIETENAQYEAMKKRIKFMYEQGDTFYLEIMLSAESFGDFLTRADYIDMISAYDQKMLKSYKEAREWTEICKETLESEKAALDEAEVALEEEEASVQALIDEKEIELANYTRDIKNKEAQINEAEAEYAEEVAVISELEKQIAEEKKKLNRSVIYDGGQFAWPCPNYVRVTDDFGYRTDPITGATSYHSGIDLGAPAGSPILAAYDGVVVAATYNWSMGNYIMIDHGDGLYTIYMHASKLYVSVNDTVTKGQTIAAVGTTGRSTGNHLHFGVRLNGAYVSPWNYLK